jgi:leucyl/phenylalanyl-tRNA--protein transferase
VSDRIVDALLNAYRNGHFPMADPRTEQVDLYCPDPRAIIPSGGLHVPRSLAKRMRTGGWTLTSDTCFPRVMRGCAEARDTDESWIDDRLIGWYTELFEAGHAHTVEVWRGVSLVGGIYGVSIGGAFFGESMFSRPLPRLDSGERDPQDGADASRVALVVLVRHLERCGYTLFDTQFQNEHIEQFGVVEIDRDGFMEKLAQSTAQPDPWTPPADWDALLAGG